MGKSAGGYIGNVYSLIFKKTGMLKDGTDAWLPSLSVIVSSYCETARGDIS